MKELAEKEIKRMDEIFKKIKSNHKIVEDARRYFEDSKYFFEKGMYVEAFESAVISWAYLDACAKFGLIEIPSSLKKYFTVE